MSVGASQLGTAVLAIEQLTVADDIKVNARLIDQVEKAAAAARSALGRRMSDGARASAIKT